jgi:hypothetical protein
MPRVEIVVPVPSAESTAIRGRIDEKLNVVGQKVAIVDTGWKSMARLKVYLERELRETYGVAEVLHFDHAMQHTPPPEYYDKIAAQVAGAITGLGN